MPDTHASIDIVIAEFNELSRQGEDGFDAQLDYFSELSRYYNVILVDDASTDGSWERIVERSPGLNPRLHLMRMEKNGRKVQAVKRAVEASDADYILLSDFDSRIANPGDIPNALVKFARNPSLAGLSLKLVPEGDSLFSRFQDVEYAMSRKIWAAYLNRQGRQRCLPGAAAIWNRSIYLRGMREHSGRHNGDDLESTAIALRNGYSTEYTDEVVVTTMVPQGPRAFFAQRSRWDLGGLETYHKERKFFSNQMKNLRSRLGHVTLLDWYSWVTALLYPVFIFNWWFDPKVALGYMCFELTLALLMGVLSRKEFRSRSELLLVPLFPLYRVMAIAPRLAAVYRFVSRARFRSEPSAPLLIQSIPMARSLSRKQVPVLVPVE